MNNIRFYRPNMPYTDLRDILSTGILVNGPYTEALEQHFKDRFGVKYAIACANCTSGLVITLSALGIKDSYVGIPAFTWPSTRYALECNNCTSLYYDIDKKTWLIDNKPRVFTEPRAIVAVDTFGNECNLSTDIPVIYDAAHSYGLPHLGKRGIAEVVSFAATKLVTGGQGGMILTNNKDLATEARKLVKLYAKITEVSALFCLESIDSYEHGQQRVKDSIIDMYREEIKIPFREQKIETSTNYSVYAILLEDKLQRDIIVKQFEENGVEVKIYYKPLISLDNANYIYDRILCLPVYEQMKEDVPFIAHLINKARR